MLLGELLTLRQLKLPVKLVVFNNSTLGFVELEMKAAGLLDFATDLVNPNFAQLAESAGLLGLRVEKPEELRPAIKQALVTTAPRWWMSSSIARSSRCRPPSPPSRPRVSASTWCAPCSAAGATR